MLETVCEKVGELSSIRSGCLKDAATGRWQRAQRKPRVSGAEFRRNVEPENRTGGYRSTDSRLALRLRSRCDSDHKNAFFTAHCLAGHVRLELRNAVANYLFESLHRFAGVQPSGLQHRCLYTAPFRLQSSVAHGLLRPRGHSSSCGCCLAGGGWSTIFITAVLLACTIIGIPFAWAHVKVAGLAIAQLRRGGERQKKRGRRTATAAALQF